MAAWTSADGLEAGIAYAQVLLTWSDASDAHGMKTERVDSSILMSMSKNTIFDNDLI